MVKFKLKPPDVRAADLRWVDRFFGGVALALLAAVVALLMLNGPRAKAAEPTALVPPATKSECAKSECPKECEARARAAFAFAKLKADAPAVPAAAPAPHAVEKKTGAVCPCAGCECASGKPCTCGPNCACPNCAGKPAAKPTAKVTEPETELWLVNGVLYRVPKGAGPPACAGGACPSGR